jgi:hypothetical protein
VAQPERVGHERRGVGHHLVGGRRRDEHEVDLVERHRGAVQRLAAGADGEVGQPLARRRVAALPDAGAGLDPGVVDAQAPGDLGVGHDALGQCNADRRDLLARRRLGGGDRAHVRGQ